MRRISSLHRSARVTAATRAVADTSPNISTSTASTTSSSSSNSSTTVSASPLTSTSGNRSLVSSTASTQGNLILDRLPPRPPKRSQNVDDENVQKDASSSGSPDNRNGSGGPPPLKVKRKAPWGAQQLRDAWSVDAMTKGEKDNMNERMHREYRYHPHEQQRRALKWMALSLMPSFISGMCVAYYYYEGKMLWQGDPQYILNMLRSVDTSPRSKFYPWRMAGQEEWPEHLKRYREARLATIAKEKELAAERERKAELEVEAAVRGSQVSPLAPTVTALTIGTESKTMLDVLGTEETLPKATNGTMMMTKTKGAGETKESMMIEAVPKQPAEEATKPIQYFRITGMAGAMRGVISEGAES